MEDKKTQYYQFRKEDKIPFYIQFEDTSFKNNFDVLLKEYHFTKIDEKEVSEISLNSESVKVVKIIAATPRVAIQIGQSSIVMDKYGPESLTPRGSYDVYRYKGIAMMMMAHGNYYWELGVHNAHIEETQEAMRIVMNRVIAWALEPLGIIGFWGVPVEEGVVVMSQAQSKGEAIYVDLKSNRVFTVEGDHQITTEFKILRLDETLSGKSITMKKEQLISFLSTRSTYFSYSGITFEIKKSIFDLASITSGLVYPFENYKPRAEL